MIRRRIVFISTTALLLLISPMVSPAWRDSGLETPPKDAVLETLRQIPLRSHPPKQGLFYSGKGEEIGAAVPGDCFRIKAVIRIRKPLGDESWLCLERLGTPLPPPEEDEGGRRCGWAYWGSPGLRNFNLLATP